MAGCPALVPGVVERVGQMRSNGKTVSAIAAELGVSRSTVQRASRQALAHSDEPAQLRSGWSRDARAEAALVAAISRAATKLPQAVALFNYAKRLRAIERTRSTVLADALGREAAPPTRCRRSSR